MADETPTQNVIAREIWPPAEGGRTPMDAPARVLSALRAYGWQSGDEVATLFDQRDAAIAERDRLRALVGDEEVDREHWGTVPRDEAIRQANEKHGLFMEWHDRHDRRRDERDEARAEVERMRPVLEAADAERAKLAVEVNRLQALTRIVEVTTMSDADRRMRCNTCGHVTVEPRESIDGSVTE